MDEQSTTYRIPGPLLAALGSVWGGAPSALSPFRSADNKAAGPHDLAALQGLGCCDAQGRVLPAAAPLLQVLGAPSSFVRVYLSGGGAVRECVVYRDALGASASLANIAGEFDLECPASTATLVALVAQMTGGSALRSVDFQTSLSGMEAVALAAAIDLQRRGTLRAMADDGPVGAVDLYGQLIATVCATRGTSEHGLCNHMLDLAGSTGLPQDGIYRALTALTKMGLLVQGQKAIRLSDNLLQVAQRLLLTERALTLTAGTCGTGGRVAVAGFCCLQAGVHDLLYIEIVDDAVELRMESAAAIAEQVRAFLEDPAVMEGLAFVEPAPVTPAQSMAAPFPRAAAATAARACPVCHKPNAADAKFCESCGANMHTVPAPPAALYCARCKQPLEPGVKFCPGCGLATAAMAPAAAPAASLQKTCPRCAAVVTPDTWFCPGCGLKVG